MHCELSQGTYHLLRTLHQAAVQSVTLFTALADTEQPYSPRACSKAPKGGSVWFSTHWPSCTSLLTMALQSPIWGRENIAPPKALLPVSGLPSASMMSAAPMTRPLGFTLSTSSANSGCPAASKSLHQQSAPCDKACCPDLAQTASRHLHGRPPSQQWSQHSRTTCLLGHGGSVLDLGLPL